MAPASCAARTLAWSIATRPDSPRWTEEGTQQVDALRAQELKLATTVVTHDFFPLLKSVS
ncbi:hypothetical protein [Streptomyces sp. NPDC048650]|uniref:hypothetical protein n=1 Tax=Streptomyces sp. NPDC048650 TaxID=3365583 RepID=UPI00371EC33D